MKKILITGAGGLVGKASIEHCRALGDEVAAYDHQSLDITDAAQVQAVISRESPDAVINCAAWTDVDGCESDPAKAERANASGPENLARACRHANAGFLTISTDYVFDGAKSDFYTQRDDPNPLSVYGRCKLAGERRAQAEYARTIVVRTGYIFGPGGRNFLSVVVDRAKRGEKLKAIRDCWGTPTYGRDLAARLRELVELDLPGVFHVVSSGNGATFETFAQEALKLAGCNSELLESVTMDSLARPAPRPRSSKLKCLLSEALGLSPLPPWQEGLAHFVVRSAEGATRR
ncbi:MAG TPA: dTDP-4-dehydrorhamnose reductase [Pyrinomonadaceae bacterium]|nr:dTDP-4-dehydrorhamnose reductase [Pyrinomonadaceae bacterium]